MKNLISISTGLVYKFTDKRNEMIRMLREFSPDGIELSFADSTYLFDFKISEENVDYLRSLPYTTIHAPWIDIRYANNDKSKKVLDLIEKLYRKTGAKNVTIEPREIDDYSILGSYDFQISIENADIRKPFCAAEELLSILNKNPKLKLTLDIAHSMTANPDLFDQLLSTGKISQIHAAYFDISLSDHFFFHKYATPELIAQIKKIPENIPLVLEAVAGKREEISSVRDEIKFLRSL
ncbi:MAG: hypothetical protein WC080_01370 [Patescibacteria group bacterium]|jgi:sugar phosphate isomerase/epimerase